MKKLQTVLDVLERIDAVERGMVTTKAHHYAAREETTEAIAIINQMMQAESVGTATEFCYLCETTGDQFGYTSPSYLAEVAHQRRGFDLTPDPWKALRFDDKEMCRLICTAAYGRNGFLLTPVEHGFHTNAAPVAVQAVPAGFVLVPVEPTDSMVNAGRTTPMPSDSEWDEDEDYRAVYKAMLAAAPKGAV
jgi:hypothetical protein